MRTHFGSFVFDRETRQLREGESPRLLKPKAFDLLNLPIERRPAAVSKQEIRDRLWPDSFVSESTLSSLAALVRRALGPDGASPAVLRDDDEFRLGQTPLVFRIHSASASTATER
jgi:DNA-binding winged helix-turn-helix (wHTH) protein